MAVEVADTMKAKNSLDFPVVESSDIKGGIHCVTTIAERDELLNSAKKQAGMLVYVSGTNGAAGTTYQMNDDMLGFHSFTGELTSNQLQDILTYVEANIEHSVYSEDESGQGILELL